MGCFGAPCVPVGAGTCWLNFEMTDLDEMLSKSKTRTSDDHNYVPNDFYDVYEPPGLAQTDFCCAGGVDVGGSLCPSSRSDHLPRVHSSKGRLSGELSLAENERL